MVGIKMAKKEIIGIEMVEKEMIRIEVAIEYTAITSKAVYLKVLTSINSASCSFTLHTSRSEFSMLVVLF